MNMEQTPRPTVSVVMCTYNGERFLQEQMNSILEQDYPLHELIVQDDRSTDGTWAMLQDYERRFPGLIRLYRNEERMGFNANFRSAMGRATGEFVAIADQDDIWFPQKIRRQVETIGTADLSFSDYYRDAEYPSPHAESPSPQAGNTPRLKARISPAGTMPLLFFHNIIPGHTLLVRRTFLQRPDAWNAGFYYDWWFLVVASLDGHGVAHICEPLNWHRPHAGSAIAQFSARHRRRHTVRPTWQPYLLGWNDLRRMRKLPAWNMFYAYLEQHTSRTHQPLVHEMSRAIRRPALTPRLCLLCCRHRAEVYPQSKGWRQALRAFFLPAIYAYGNTAFDFQ